MIKLLHLKQCSSVIQMPAIDFDLRLNFCTDTRKYVHPSAFVAIPGQKVNPLDIINELLTQGCPLVVYQKDEVNDGKVAKLKQDFPRTTFLPVKDSVTFLQELTHHHVQNWKRGGPRRKVFAISGSNGKTTHKEMLSHILHSIVPGKVIATEKNNNNHLGVPLTLLPVSDKSEIVLLELGSNHPGEIKVLCDISMPDAGITTNIGATHLEFFGSEEKVFQEEAYLYHAVKMVTAGKGTFLLNVDDPYLKTLPSTEGTVRYGEDDNAEAKIKFFDRGAEITYQGEKLRVLNEHITGEHNKLNLITCAFIACLFYPEHRKGIVQAAAEFRPTKNRSEWIEFDGRAVYLDAYNANPSSMKAAIQGFKESVLARGQKIEDACVVLGDMNELGEKTPAYHEEVARFVKEQGFSNVFYVGRYADHYLKGHPEGKKRASSAEFKSEYRSDCLKKFSIHFIKGSRSLQLESLFDIT